MAKLKFFSTLKVAGNCTECKARIEGKLWTTTGVHSADWNPNTQLLALQYDHRKIRLEEIKTIILQLGHDVDEEKASTDAYHSLPSSCRYRNP